MRFLSHLAHTALLRSFLRDVQVRRLRPMANLQLTPEAGPWRVYGVFRVFIHLLFSFVVLHSAKASWLSDSVLGLPDLLFSSTAAVYCHFLITFQTVAVKES